MAFTGSFDWREKEGRLFRPAPPEARFDPGIAGIDEWTRLTFALRQEAPEFAAETLGRLQELPQQLPVRRLFISHRRIDVAAALQVRDIAKRCGYEYWLDVEDPVLQGIPSSGSRTHAIVVAATIEIALLNCSHVIAVLTNNSLGVDATGQPTQSGASLWIPYEYGRVKARTVISDQAACWLKDGVDPLPEYLYLGRILKTTQEIEGWLRSRP